MDDVNTAPSFDPLEVRLTLGTAGHIDHGKTALVEALTGRNTDRLPEERRRGLSIELGFAELELPEGHRFSLVDVPGHERFIRTMVAGATGIDLFLMVVAADDGVMPQTREHWVVLRSLGVERGVLAITKCDLVDRRRRRVVAEEARRLVPNAPLVEVSAIQHRGVEALRRALAQVAEEAKAYRRAQSPRLETDPVLHVDRVFTLKGIGLVVTGVLWSGSLSRGDQVKILPSGAKARIRAIQVHDRDERTAVAGRRVALNIAGVDRHEVRRGDAVTSVDAIITPSYRVDVELTLEHGAGALDGTRVEVHHGTRNSPARVVLLDESAQLAQLRLASPLVARAADRLVIRAITSATTLGGGVVLDPNPRRHRGGPELETLKLLREGPPERIVEAQLRETQTGIPADPQEWGSLPILGPAMRRYPASRWHEVISRLKVNGTVRTVGGRLVLSAPDAARGSTTPRAVLRLSPFALRVLALLRSDGSRPRAPQALATELGTGRREALALLEELRAAGHAVRVSPSVYYAAEELQRLRIRLVALISQSGSTTVAEVRDELGTSRKYAQALLEHLDSERVTVRQGDRRVLRLGDHG